jgi:putative flippase GtrA
MNLHFSKSLLHLFWKIDNKFLRFLVVGCLNTAVGYGLFVLLIWLGLHYGIALLISQILGVAFNYKTTGVLVFESRSNKLLLHFFAVYGVVYLINLFELYLLNKSSLYEVILSSHWLDFLKTMPLNPNKIGDVIGQTIVTFPNAMLAFFLNKIFVFSSNK